MAFTGLFLVFFILFHMYGNLKMLLGPDAFNGYAAWMREAFYPILPHGGFLLIFRILLAASFLVHGYAAFKLWGRASKARGSAYVAHNTLATSYAVRTVRWGAIILIVFIIFHLAQFTWLAINLGADYSSMLPYDRVVFTFSQWYWVLGYAIVMIILGMHLRHGVWSAMATLGANKKSRELAINITAWVIAAAVVVGFLIPPVLILLDVIN